MYPLSNSASVVQSCQLVQKRIFQGALNVFRVGVSFCDLVTWPDPKSENENMMQKCIPNSRATYAKIQER